MKQYLFKDDSFTAPENTTKCLIFDYTEIAKTGSNIEGIFKVHNHVSKTYYLIFKLLVAGYLNGNILISIDFNWHCKAKNKIS